MHAELNSPIVTFIVSAAKLNVATVCFCASVPFPADIVIPNRSYAFAKRLSDLSLAADGLNRRHFVVDFA